MDSALSTPMRDLLWRVAQHKYGWCYVNPSREDAVARALERRGLVEYHRDPGEPSIVATKAGKAEIKRRWPVSPFILRTYDHQPGGWTPREGALA